MSDKLQFVVALRQAKAYRTLRAASVGCAVPHFIGIITVSDDHKIGDKQYANII
jgi:hypothetical protein